MLGLQLVILVSDNTESWKKLCSSVERLHLQSSEKPSIHLLQTAWRETHHPHTAFGRLPSISHTNAWWRHDSICLWCHSTYILCLLWVSSYNDLSFSFLCTVYLFNLCITDCVHAHVLSSLIEPNSWNPPVKQQNIGFCIIGQNST